MTIRLPYGDDVLAVPSGARLWQPCKPDEVGGLFDRAVAAQPEWPIGWLAKSGGLIANLRGWENIVLAATYHRSCTAASLATTVAHWLARLGYDAAARERLLAAPTASLMLTERLAIGLVRTVLAQPALVLVEPGWFARWSDASWREALIEAMGPAVWFTAGDPPPPADWGFKNFLDGLTDDDASAP
jgi:hypothetical protein